MDNWNRDVSGRTDQRNSKWATLKWVGPAMMGQVQWASESEHSYDMWKSHVTKEV